MPIASVIAKAFGLDVVLSKVLDRIPDPNARKAAAEELEQQLVAAEASYITGQLEINKAEAASQFFFVAGWRPAIGWVGVAAFAWAYILLPTLQVVLPLVGRSDIVLPNPLDDKLWELITALLGLGAYRSYEKVKGVASGRR